MDGNDPSEIHLITKQHKVNQQQNRPVSLLVFNVDTKLIRHRQANEKTIYLGSRKARSISKGFTDASKRNLLFRLRNATGMKFFITLTYPTLPEALSDDELRTHRKRLLRELRKHSVSGFIVAESNSKREGLHYHLIIDKSFTVEEVMRIWSKSIDVKNISKYFQRYGVVIEEIYDQNTLASYVSKAKGKHSNLPVKYWSAFGKCRGLPSHKILNGTASELAPIVRIAKTLDKGKRRQNVMLSNGRLHFYKFRDTGKSGRTLYDISEVLRKRVLTKESMQDCG